MQGTSSVGRGNRSTRFALCSLSPQIVPGSEIPRCDPHHALPTVAGHWRAPVPVVR